MLDILLSSRKKEMTLERGAVRGVDHSFAAGIEFN
jgi:hypothetical protein